MNHYPWDGGSVSGFFGKFRKQKTIATVCSRRVAFHRANPESSITCADCRAKLEADRKDHVAMLAHMERDPMYADRVKFQDRVRESIASYDRLLNK